MLNNKKEKFSLSKLRALSTESTINSKKYINDYFIPLTNGNHAFMNKDGKYEIISHEILNRVYINRFPKPLKAYYNHELDEVLTPVFKLNKPVKYEDNLNLCSQLKEAVPFKSLPENDKKLAKVFLNDFMFEVLCSKNEAVFIHLKKWMANMMKGNKNNCALVLKTASEGVGKSTLHQMIRKHILPNDLCLECGSEPLKNKFNSVIGGKLLVSFEELESVSIGEWMTILNVLKRQITSDTIMLENKGSNAYETDNINNYMLLSNYDLPDDGRRFFVLDISTHRKGQLSDDNKKFWSYIYGKCFNDNVGYALYCYFREIDTTDFNPQAYPETNSKLASISKKLDSVHNFLKIDYVLKHKDMHGTIDEIVCEYNQFCIREKILKPSGKINFNEKMKDIGINFFRKKIDNKQYNKYKISHNDLLVIAKKNKWLNELDVFSDNDDGENDNEFECKQSYCELQMMNNKKEMEIKELMERVKCLEKTIEDMKVVDEVIPKEKKIKKVKKVKKEKKLKQNEIKLADKEIYDNESEDEMTPEEIEDMMNNSVMTHLSPIIVKNKKKNK